MTHYCRFPMHPCQWASVSKPHMTVKSLLFIPSAARLTNDLRSDFRWYGCAVAYIRLGMHNCASEILWAIGYTLESGWEWYPGCCLLCWIRGDCWLLGGIDWAFSGQLRFWRAFRHFSSFLSAINDHSRAASASLFTQFARSLLSRIGAFPACKLPEYPAAWITGSCLAQLTW